MSLDMLHLYCLADQSIPWFHSSQIQNNVSVSSFNKCPIQASITSLTSLLKCMYNSSPCCADSGINHRCSAIIVADRSAISGQVSLTSTYRHQTPCKLQPEPGQQDKAGLLCHRVQGCYAWEMVGHDTQLGLVFEFYVVKSLYKLINFLLQNLGT